MRNTKPGFSLIEVLVGLGVISVLVAIAAFGLSAMQRNSRDSRRVEVGNEIKRGVESYYNENGNYPDKSAFKLNGDLLQICYDKACTDSYEIKAEEKYLEGVIKGSGTDSTVYCYGSQPGGTYVLGVQKESGEWIEQGTSSATSCGQSEGVPPTVFIDDDIIIDIPTPTPTPTPELTKTITPFPTKKETPTIIPTKEITKIITKKVTPTPTPKITFTPYPTSDITQIPTIGITKYPTKKPTDIYERPTDYLTY